MNWKHILFGFDGRISRKQYWLSILISICFLAVALGLIFLISYLDIVPALPFYIFIPPILVIAWIQLAIVIKRLHDRNKTGWFYLLYITLPNAADRISDRIEEDTLLWWFILLIGLVVGIWGFIELGFLKGTEGSNDYGDDPLA